MTQEQQEPGIDPEIQALIDAKKVESGETKTEETETQVSETEHQEVQTQEEAKEEPKEDSKSQFYAQLVQKDREIYQLKKALKEHQQNPQDNIKELAKKDPTAALKELGILPDDLLDIWSKDSEPLEEKQDDPRFKKLEELETKIQQLEEEKKQKELEGQYVQQLQWLDKVITDSGDKWELIGALKGEGSYQYVLQVAQHIFNDTGQIPQMDMILDHVEADLEEQYGNRVGQYLQINKIKSRLPKEEPKVAVEKKQQVTLSNDLAAETTPQDDSAEARRERAWQLYQALEDNK